MGRLFVGCYMIKNKLQLKYKNTIFRAFMTTGNILKRDGQDCIVLDNQFASAQEIEVRSLLYNY